MGRGEAVVTQKSGKTPSPPKDQPAFYPYLDWSTMQAYYGPGVLPPTYFGPTMPSGHAPPPPPYLWGPQTLIPSPFGKPYAAIYPHAGGCSHPFVPLMVNPLSTEPAKSTNSKEKSPNKRLKEIDGTAVSVGSGNSEKASEDFSADGSSDKNDLKVSQTPKKWSLEDGPGSGAEISGTSKMEYVSSPNDTTGEPEKLAILPKLCIPVTAVKPNAASANNLRAIGMPVLSSPGVTVVGCNGVSTELSTKDERELKRERRKQSNRESARRSRLRKQAETEELARKVELLTAENTSLRSEISRLTESSKKLRLENSALMVKVTEAATNHVQGVSLDKTTAPSSLVENFLSMIDSTSTSSIGKHIEHGAPKLRQLLGSGQASDAVAAS